MEWTRKTLYGDNILCRVVGIAVRVLNVDMQRNHSQNEGQVLLHTAICSGLKFNGEFNSIVLGIWVNTAEQMRCHGNEM